MSYAAGESVGPGFYWSLNTGEQLNVREGKGVLPGHAGAKFYRLPWFGMLLLAPVLGGLFVMFLPVIGIVLTVQFVAEKVGHKMVEWFRAMAPVAAHPELAGQVALTKKDEKAPEGEAKAEMKPEDKALADEIAARRENGEK